jgi:hypothetical protein
MASYLALRDLRLQGGVPARAGLSIINANSTTHTNATVFAADRIQWYSRYQGLSNGRYEFGAWEENLWCFPASGNPPSIVARPPVEFSDVMSGIAP